MPARTKHATNECKRSGFRTIERDLPGGGVVKTLHLQFGGTQVYFLVRELRSHMLRGTAKNKNNSKKQ